MKPVAAIDIGSNTVHLLVGLPRSGKSVKHKLSRSVLLRLGREVERHGKIRAGKQRRLEKALRDHVDVARRAGAERILIGATRALRAATNGAKVVQDLERVLAVPVRLLAATTEAHLAFLGAKPDLEGTAPQLLIDSGSASTEVTLIDARGHCTAVSLPLGADLLRAGLQRDPPGLLEWAHLALHLADSMKSLPPAPRPSPLSPWAALPTASKSFTARAEAPSCPSPTSNASLAISCATAPVISPATPACRERKSSRSPSAPSSSTPSSATTASKTCKSATTAYATA